MKRTYGFTLIELMVTVAVSAILLAVAAPSFTSLYNNTSAASAIGNIENSIAFARNQAINFGRKVSICPGSGSSCSGNWINGYIIFIDDDGDNTSDSGTETLKVIQGFNSKDFIKASSTLITFGMDGMLSSTSSISIHYCPSKKNSEYSKGISISPSGKIASINTSINCN
ncbi:GspH/FimT family pseudopilin [Shewanella frigidimarina]|uniref:GspH/FimT family pseudopilin n=1 Tax=Shewanella frigidimarina TaxID=56812 RepID=UPI003D7B8A8D